MALQNIKEREKDENLVSAARNQANDLITELRELGLQRGKFGGTVNGVAYEITESRKGGAVYVYVPGHPLSVNVMDSDPPWRYRLGGVTDRERVQQRRRAIEAARRFLANVDNVKAQAKATLQAQQSPTIAQSKAASLG